MLQSGGPATLGWGVFSIFAVLAGLALLTGADHAAPGCTGPAVERCDYIEAAKAAVAEHPYRRFDPELGFEIVEAGSSVRVQQYLPHGSLALFEGPAVLIDRKSCRPCSIQVRDGTRMTMRRDLPASRHLAFEWLQQTRTQDIVVPPTAD